MNIKIFDAFQMLKEKEDFNVIRNNIDKDAVFKGTNLWVLIFAILIASLGLNVNSTAVVIGAMLISPLMGPIMAVGFGVAVNDLPLIKKAASNYLFSMLVGLIASTLYFIATPIQDAHSEILARTFPTIYDVMIALFGGFAGIIAYSSKQKGNVVAGVAIATALMPPLCTAGYGLATLQFSYFFGAFYLYLINSVFIATATIITAYVAKFPIKKYENPADEKREKRIIIAVVVLTLIPSLYLGYLIVERKKFTDRANRFIESEATIPNNYLLKSDVDPKSRKITLVFGGQEITKQQIQELETRTKYYDLTGISLVVKQGFSLKDENISSVKLNRQTLALADAEIELKILRSKFDSIADFIALQRKVSSELKIQYPLLVHAGFSKQLTDTGSTRSMVVSAMLVFNQVPDSGQNEVLRKWIKARMEADSVSLIVAQSVLSPVK